MLVAAKWIYYFTGVHPPIRVPDPLELAEGAYQLLAEHPGQEFAPRLAVSMLAGEGPPVANHQVRGLAYKGTVPLDTCLRPQVKTNAAVDASLAKVPIESALILVGFEQPAQISQVVAQMLRRNRRIFPSWPGIRLSGHRGAGGQPRFAHLPDLALLHRVAEELHRRCITLPLQFLHEEPGAIIRLSPALAAKLDEEPAASRRQQIHRRPTKSFLPQRGHQFRGEALQADGMVLHHLGDMISRAVDIRISKYQQRALRGTGDQAKGSL